MDLIVHYAFDCTTNVWSNHLNFQLMRLKLCNAHLHRTQNTKAELSRSLAHLPWLKLAHLCDSNFNRFTKIITELDTISKTLNRKNWVHFGVVCVMCIDYRIETCACACAVYFCKLQCHSPPHRVLRRRRRGLVVVVSAAVASNDSSHEVCDCANEINTDFSIAFAYMHCDAFGIPFTV